MALEVRIKRLCRSSEEARWASDLIPLGVSVIGHVTDAFTVQARFLFSESEPNSSKLQRFTLPILQHGADRPIRMG